MAKKAVAAPAVDRRYQQALELFERAIKALGRKDLDRARELLDALLEDHADQQELVERARAYRALCDRPRRGPRPRTFEELLNYGVVLHNNTSHSAGVNFAITAYDLHNSKPRQECKILVKSQS